MDKGKYKKREDLKWEIPLKRGGPYRWKDNQELLEMVGSCAKESNQYTSEKEWVESSWANLEK